MALWLKRKVKKESDYLNLTKNCFSCYIYLNPINTVPHKHCQVFFKKYLFLSFLSPKVSMILSTSFPKIMLLNSRSILIMVMFLSLLWPIVDLKYVFIPLMALKDITDEHEAAGIDDNIDAIL